ncbi:MAG: dihydrofolate reductase family protein [Candidatus Pacebacteria bacterium]|nr:dihydrofolate reductase family protein [Candidatus Paceibacterota bacterium]
MIPVTLIMAITLDGKIAKNSQHFANWTSPEDKKHFFKISKEFGVMMMGENTFKTLPGVLPGRLNVIFSHKKAGYEEKDLKYVSGEPEKVLEELEALGYKQALLCGGTFLNSLFLEKQLITEMIITIEPKIFGQGLSLFDTEANYSLELKELKKINNNSLTLRYKIIY